MTLKLYNTLTRTKEQFAPLDNKNIRMYVCGPTVYDNAHIGNARPVIVFDVLFRLLRHLYGENHVTYARNITDVDDKINKRAFERWTKQRPLVQEIRELTDKTLAQFHADIDALGVLRPTYEPRATDYIARGDNTLDMVKVITRLIEKGNAYEAEGHVLFSVPSMPDYGGLSRRPKDDMIAGARVEVAPYKRDPMDFVLWKPSNPELEPGWDSPWGYGRPGWHIECTAMSGALFGDVFDIHGGGLDLIFPHHENEIAQSCCYSGQPKMANIWMHNGFLQVEGEKMSKSTGNFMTINEVLESWSGETIRLNMLKTHYRQPIDWTAKGMEECDAMLRNWHQAIGGQEAKKADISSAVIASLCDDLNVAQVIAELHALAKAEEKDQLIASLQFLGLYKPETYFKKVNIMPQNSQKIEALIADRIAARASKNFVESDRLRDELVSMGIEIQDGKDASGIPITSWKVKG
jgi:cysteinyl-tRNA synthetase